MTQKEERCLDMEREAAETEQETTSEDAAQETALAVILPDTHEDFVYAQGAVRQMQIWKKTFPYEDAAARFPTAVAVFGQSLSFDEKDAQVRAKWTKLDEDLRLDIMDSARLEQVVFGDVNCSKWPSIEEIAPWTAMIGRVLPKGLPPEKALTERKDGLEQLRTVFAAALAASDAFMRSTSRTMAGGGWLNGAISAFARAKESDPLFEITEPVGGWRELAGNEVKKLADDFLLSSTDIAAARECAAWILLSRNAEKIERKACELRMEAKKKAAGGTKPAGGVWEHLRELKAANLSKPGSGPP